MVDRMDAYSLFYTENRERLYAYLLHMTGDGQLAADLVQESFLRYLARYGKNKGSRPLLYRIARNAALDAARRPEAVGDVPESSRSPIPDPERQTVEREAFNRVLAALDQLPAAERDVLSLVVWGGMPYREIASVLKISEANVKVRVHRARNRLRAALDTVASV